MTNAKPIRISVRKDQRATKTSRLPTLPPQARCTHPNEKSECVYFFSVEYFGIKVDLDGKKKKQPGVQAKVYSKSYSFLYDFCGAFQSLGFSCAQKHVIIMKNRITGFFSRH